MFSCANEPLILQIRHMIHHALRVLHRPSPSSAHACNLMALEHHARCGEPELLIDLYRRMGESELPSFTGRSYVMLAKACIELEDVDTGRRLHADALRMGMLDTNAFVASALVDMYAKCGLLGKAQETFEMISIPNVVAWNALLTGYADHGCFEEVLRCSKQMQYEGVAPDSITYMCCLRACSGTGAALEGKALHGVITRKGFLEGDVFLGSTLIDMYAKCDMVMEAKNVLLCLPVRNVVSWNALISAYVDSKHGEQALLCFEQMQHEGVSPSPVTFIHGLKACNDAGSIGELHVEIAKRGLLEQDVMLGSTLVYAYAKLGMLTTARDVFDKLLVHNVVSWNALIVGYVEHGYGDEALGCFEKMQRSGLSPDAVTLISILKACIIAGTVSLGEHIHLEIAKKGLEGDQLLSSTVIHMYAKCGNSAKAQEVFDELSHQNVVSWTALITGYAELGNARHVLACFEQMSSADVLPNNITYICSLKACASVGAIAKGQEMHVEIVKQGMETDSALGGVLIDMYADACMLIEALGAFEGIQVHEVFSWTSLIRANVECHRDEEAIKCFERMQVEGVSPDTITYVFGIKACTNVGDTRKAAEMHGEIMKRGLETELLIGNALIDMYAKRESIEAAWEVFGKLQNRDVVSWNAMLTALIDVGCNEHVFECLKEIQHEGICPDPVTFICSLVSCANVGGIAEGQEIHAEITKRGLEKEMPISNGLIDLYIKCGSCTIGKCIFDSLGARTIVTWNTLITGYAQLSESTSVLELFDAMLKGGALPDLVTFLNVLNACSHAGLVDVGQVYFGAMVDEFDLIPAIEHHNCMVDLFGRAGNIDEAVAMIRMIPLHPGATLLQTVLASCRWCRNVEVGRLAFEDMMGSDGYTEDAAYICMYSIYVEAAMHEDANKVELMRARR